MKKKYLFAIESRSVVQNKNNFLYFGEMFSKYLDYLVSKNNFVVKNKLKVSLFLWAFLLGTFLLSFVIWSVFETFQVFLIVLFFWGVNMSEFDDLIVWLEKESKKPFVSKKVSFSKVKLLNWFLKWWKNE